VNGDAGKDPDSASRTAIKEGGKTGNNVGSYQQDEFKSHSHSYQGLVDEQSNRGHDSGFHLTGRSSGATGGSETRPKNAYVFYIIKT